jgi:hypothetical protein
VDVKGSVKFEDGKAATKVSILPWRKDTNLFTQLKCTNNSSVKQWLSESEPRMVSLFPILSSTANSGGPGLAHVKSDTTTHLFFS